MRRAIWKYPLVTTDRQVIEMPAGSGLLSVALQQGSICLWAMVDQDKAFKEQREIVIIGTGNPIDEGRLFFIGTVLQGSFVWHVFEAMKN